MLINDTVSTNSGARESLANMAGSPVAALLRLHGRIMPESRDCACDLGHSGIAPRRDRRCGSLGTTYRATADHGEDQTHAPPQPTLLMVPATKIISRALNRRPAEPDKPSQACQ
jgi:hypothetical protein